MGCLAARSNMKSFLILKFENKFLISIEILVRLIYKLDPSLIKHERDGGATYE